MSARGRPSRKSMEARLKALDRELRRLGIKTGLPSRIPSDAAGIDRLAGKLLTIHLRHRHKLAFELIFDLAGPMVAECVVAQLEMIFTEVTAEEIVAHVFSELSRPDQPPLPADGRSFRRQIEALLPDVIDRLDRRERIVEERLPPPLRVITGRTPRPATPEVPDARRAGDVKEAIARNFLSLPELTQRCFILHLVEGKSLPDVAQELGLSLAAVSRRMAEARRRALTLLEGQAPGGPGEQRHDTPETPEERPSSDEDPSEGGDS